LPTHTSRPPLSLPDALPILGGILHIGGTGKQYGVIRQLFNCIAVRHPNLGTRPDASEKRIVLFNERQMGPTVFAHVRRGYDSVRSEEHTSELQSRENLVCRL